MKENSSFQVRAPSDGIVAFLERAENADPNSLHISADDNNMNWGHHLLSHTSKFSNTFCCTSHEGEVYFKKQSFTSTSSTFSESQVWE